MLTPYSFKKGPDEDASVIALFDDEFVESGFISKEVSGKIHHAYNVCQAHDFQPFMEITTEQALEIINSATEFISTIEQKLSEQS